MTGELISMEKVHNKVPDAGITGILGVLAGTGQGPIAYFAVGTGTTAPARTDTAMQTEVYRGSVTQQIVAGPTLMIKYYLDTNSANGTTLTEAGLFDVGTGGVLFAHQVYSGVAKTSSNTVTFTWNINCTST